MAVKEDWFNERGWWTRLVYWYNRKFKGIYLGWLDEDEIAASIISYIDRFRL